MITSDTLSTGQTIKNVIWEIRFNPNKKCEKALYRVLYCIYLLPLSALHSFSIFPPPTLSALCIFSHTNYLYDLSHHVHQYPLRVLSFASCLVALFSASFYQYICCTFSAYVQIISIFITSDQCHLSDAPYIFASLSTLL